MLEEGDDMTLKTIINNASIFTDEKFNDSDLLSIANKGISRINTECGTLFPYYADINSEYAALPDSWQMDLMSLYLSYGIKMNDSSLSEADRYLDEFYKVLTSFKDKLGTLVDKYINGDTVNGVSSEYVETEGFGGVYGIDTSNAIDVGFFGSNSNGGCY
jgi:hypothetical protein